MQGVGVASLSAARAAGLIDSIDAAHARMCRAESELLLLAAEVDRHGAWQDDGARDCAHWLWMRFGITFWKARRWLAAGHALQALPRLRAAFASGRIGIDKVVELTRFATSESEADLIGWASTVSASAIRRRADLWARAEKDAVQDAARARSLTWCYTDDGRRIAIEGEFPAAQGEVIVKAITRTAAIIPVMPGEEDAAYNDARCADALYALASSTLAEDADPDRATLVIHADAEGLRDGTGGCQIQGGPVIDPSIAQRLACNARIQTIVEDGFGRVAFVGRLRREPPAWMLRQVRYRDNGCVFPGCGSKRFAEAHHIKFWRHGGRTELENLALICSFHHRLVHEMGWSMRRVRDGTLAWFRPDGEIHRPGPRVARTLQLVPDTG